MRFSSVMAMICAGYIASPLRAFSLSSMGKSQHRRTIGCRGSTTSTFAIFQDDDCEDLCDAFGAMPTGASMKKLSEDGVDSRMMSKSYALTIRTPPRRSCALWWADPGPDQCITCQGGGEITCRFCGGTSMMSAIGGDTNTLFYEGIGKDCPVCDDGVEVCNRCAGTGWVFSWSIDRNRTDSVHP